VGGLIVRGSRVVYRTGESPTSPTSPNGWPWQWSLPGIYVHAWFSLSAAWRQTCQREHVFVQPGGEAHRELWQDRHARPPTLVGGLIVRGSRVVYRTGESPTSPTSPNGWPWQWSLPGIYVHAWFSLPAAWCQTCQPCEWHTGETPSAVTSDKLWDWHTGCWGRALLPDSSLHH